MQTYYEMTFAIKHEFAKLGFHETLQDESLELLLKYWRVLEPITEWCYITKHTGEMHLMDTTFGHNGFIDIKTGRE